jgi:hypothetical protein
MGVNEIESEGVAYIQLAQNRVHMRLFTIFIGPCCLMCVKVL